MYIKNILTLSKEFDNMRTINDIQKMKDILEAEQNILSEIKKKFDSFCQHQLIDLIYESKMIIKLLENKSSINTQLPSLIFLYSESTIDGYIAYDQWKEFVTFSDININNLLNLICIDSHHDKFNDLQKFSNRLPALIMYKDNQLYKMNNKITYHNIIKFIDLNKV